jgi:hypothetical protein
VPFIGPQKIQIVDMIKSQSRFSKNDATGTDAMIYVVMQPVPFANTTDASVYPRFILNCVSKFNSEKTFVHKCAMDTTKLHYGLDDFQSDLLVTENAPNCPQGQQELVYTLTLYSNAKDVAEIKERVIQYYTEVSRPVVDSLFNETDFFKNYYVQFYDEWVKSIR